MTIHYQTGFEGSLYTLPVYTYLASTQPVTQAVVAADPHTGDNCFEIVMGAGDNYVATLPPFTRSAAATKTVFGVAIKTSDMSADEFCVGLLTSGSTSGGYLYAAIEEDGSITIRRHTALVMTGGTVLGSAPPGTFTGGVWHYIEVEVVFSDTVGTAQLWIDGTLIIDVASTDTFGGSGTITTTTTPSLQFSSSITAGVTIRLDDIYASSGVDPFGPQAHEALVPTSSIESDGVGSDGNSVDNYLLVDAVAADYVDIVSTDRERYGLSDRTETGTIRSVTVRAVVDRPAVGVIDSHLFALSNATETDGSAMVLGGGPNLRELGPLENDPNTAAAWGDAGLNALTVGVEAA